MWWGRRRGEEGAQSGKSREEEGGEETAGAGRWGRAALCSEAPAEGGCGQTRARPGPPPVIAPFSPSSTRQPGGQGARRQADGGAGSPGEGWF